MLTTAHIPLLPDHRGLQQKMYDSRKNECICRNRDSTTMNTSLNPAYTLPEGQNLADCRISPRISLRNLC